MDQVDFALSPRRRRAVADRDGGNTSQQIAGALGLAAFSTIATERAESVLAGTADPRAPIVQSEAAVEGFTLAFTIGAGLIVAAMAILVALLRREDVPLEEPSTGLVESREPVPAGA